MEAEICAHTLFNLLNLFCLCCPFSLFHVVCLFPLYISCFFFVFFALLSVFICFSHYSLYMYIFLKFVYFLFLLVFSLLYFDCVVLDFFNHAQIIIEAIMISYQMTSRLGVI